MILKDKCEERLALSIASESIRLPCSPACISCKALMADPQLLVSKSCGFHSVRRAIINYRRRLKRFLQRKQA